MSYEKDLICDDLCITSGCSYSSMDVIKCSHYVSNIKNGMTYKLNGFEIYNILKKSNMLFENNHFDKYKDYFIPFHCNNYIITIELNSKSYMVTNNITKEKTKMKGHEIYKLLKENNMEHPHFEKYKEYYNDITCNNLLINISNKANKYKYNVKDLTTNEIIIMDGVEIYNLLNDNKKKHSYFEKYKDYTKVNNIYIDTGEYSCMETYPCKHWTINIDNEEKSILDGVQIYKLLKENNMTVSHFDIEEYPNFDFDINGEEADY